MNCCTLNDAEVEGGAVLSRPFVIVSGRVSSLKPRSRCFGMSTQMGRFANRDALTTGSLSAITSISVSWIILFMTLLLCQPCLNYLSHGIFVYIGHRHKHIP